MNMHMMTRGIPVDRVSKQNRVTKGNAISGLRRMIRTGGVERSWQPKSDRMKQGHRRSRNSDLNDGHTCLGLSGRSKIYWTELLRDMV